jgi:hypothetical protein
MYTVHLLTRVFCSQVGQEFAATRTIQLRFPPFPGLGISFGLAPLFRAKHVVFNQFDGSFTLLEANIDGLLATEAAYHDWAASWRGVGFEVPDPSKPRPPYLRVVP